MRVADYVIRELERHVKHIFVLTGGDMKLFDRIFINRYNARLKHSNELDNVSVFIDGVKIPATGFEVNYGFDKFVWSDIPIKRTITLKVTTDAGI